MNDILAGRVAVVTGAGRGAGRATALTLAGAGADVALVARTESELRSVAAEVQALGRRALPVPADVADEAQVDRMAERVLSTFADVDVLVNSAGIFLRSPVDGTSLDQWNRLLAVNLTGMFLCSRAFIGSMKRLQRGHIVNISSGAGKQGYANLAGYCVTKFGVIGFSEALAAEMMPHGVKVTTLVPGTIDTTFSSGAPRQRQPGEVIRMLKPEDVAEAIVYLLTQSDRAWTQEMNLWPFKERTV
jgi:NAD(P)-dependent dehydrogenase (short-subunit alcohol dehydrogenase family)